jgi:tetratricopeptide (TPR) repeat protein
LGILLTYTGRAKEGEEAYRRALEIWRKLAVAYPKVVRYKGSVGGALSNLAEAFLKQGKLTEARRFVEEAIGQQQTALRANPGTRGNLFYRRNHYWVLARITLRQGEHARAARAAGQAAAVFPNDGAAYCRAAGLVARCIALAEKDQKLTPSQRMERAAEYGKQAMDLMRQGIRKGYKDFKKLEKDKDFAPLRAREEFRKLLAEAQGKIQAPGGK